MCITSDALQSLKNKPMDEDRAVHFMSALVKGIDDKFDKINHKLDMLIAISAPRRENSHAA